MKNKEFDNFDNTMRKLIQVPHSKIKSALDEEKAEKQKRKSKNKAPASTGARTGES
jgi:hypothetical protein